MAAAPEPSDPSLGFSLADCVLAFRVWAACGTSDGGSRLRGPAWNPASGAPSPVHSSQTRLLRVAVARGAVAPPALKHHMWVPSSHHLCSAEALTPFLPSAAAARRRRMASFAGIKTEAGRYDGVTRPYTEQDVQRLRGSVQVEHTLAKVGAEKFWKLLKTEPYIPALGALSGNQVGSGREPGPAGGRAGGRAAGPAGGGSGLSDMTCLHPSACACAARALCHLTHHMNQPEPPCRPTSVATPRARSNHLAPAPPPPALRPAPPAPRRRSRWSRPA